MIQFLPAIALARGLPWKAIACGVAVIGFFFAGVTVNGWRWEAKWNEREAQYSDAVTKATREGLEREHVLQDAFAIIDAERTAERTKANEENARLRASVDTGAIRLFVPARCPARVPETPSGSRLGDGARAELAADARPDYFALREGLIRFENKLAACQAQLKAERK